MPATIQIVDGRTVIQAENTGIAASAANRAETARDVVLAIAEPLARAAARATVYGLPESGEFARSTYELDFTEGYYRDGTDEYANLREADNSTPIVPGFSFARASSAWHNVNGDRVSVSSNLFRRGGKGLLIERQAFNSVTRANDPALLQDVSNVTIADASIDPYGITSKSITANATSAVRLKANGSGTASATGNTAWFLFKMGSGAWEPRFVLLNGSTGLLNVGFNPTTGKFTYYAGSSGARAVALSNGWWRIELTVTAGVAANDTLNVFIGFAGQATTVGDSFLLSHSQIENTPNATSAVVTTGTALSRVAEVASATLLESEDFTLVVEAELFDHTATRQVLASVDGGSALNRLTLLRDTDGTIKLELVDNGNTSTLSLGQRSGERILRAALAARQTSVRVSIDGGTTLALNLALPSGLSRILLGQDINGGQLDGYVRRVLTRDAAVFDADLQAMATLQQPRLLSDAPLTAHPLQGRFNPATGATPTGTNGRQAVQVYGVIPFPVLIAENKGISALIVRPDGSTTFRDTMAQARWCDVDPLTGYGLIGTGDLRTIRWADRQGRIRHQWTVPSAMVGNIYGIHTSGTQLIVNTENGASGETRIFTLDANGVPTGTGTQIAALTGSQKLARGMHFQTIGGVQKLWWCAFADPDNAQGCEGQLQLYDTATWALEQQFYAHFPNDVDVTPSGNVVYVDEHIDRIRRVPVVNGVVGSAESIIAGSQSRFDYEPAVSSISANHLTVATGDGSGLASVAVEYSGLDTLYAPNGVRAVTEDTFLICDTDNSRVIYARIGSGFAPEVLGVIALLNEPTKAVPMVST